MMFWSVGQNKLLFYWFQSVTDEDQQFVALLMSCISEKSGQT